MKYFWLGGLLLLAACAYISLITIPQDTIGMQPTALTSSPAEVGLTFEEFFVSPQDSNLQLAGWWMPAQEPHAILVFIHGIGSHRNSRYFGSLAFYQAMVTQGIGVVAIDLRNHGESESDTTGLQFGRTEKYDVVAAINWARKKNADLPLFAMGISMGGATVIEAEYSGAELDGLILLDSLLDTVDSFKQGGWIKTGLPPALFTISAWALTQFYGLPGGSAQALERAVTLDLPILVIQDPDDPVTRARYSQELADRNPNVTLWTVPPIDPKHPDLAWKKRWGSHVAAFQFYPQETVGQIVAFIDLSIAKNKQSKPL
ncbi:MAG: alpha/beta hydrolase [Halioglobus sp.]